MRSRAKQPRENRTITVDFQNEATYFQLLGDGKAFLEFVFAFLLSLGFQLTHKATCHGGGCLRSCTRALRIIPLPLKPATMLRLTILERGQGHGFTPFLRLCRKSPKTGKLRLPSH